MTTKGKCLDEWTMNDVRELVDAIRWAHMPKFDTQLDDEIMQRFENESLVDLYECYVVWERKLPKSRSHERDLAGRTKVLEG